MIQEYKEIIETMVEWCDRHGISPANAVVMAHSRGSNIPDTSGFCRYYRELRISRGSHSIRRHRPRLGRRFKRRAA